MECLYNIQLASVAPDLKTAKKTESKKQISSIEKSTQNVLGRTFNNFGAVNYL